ncbi:hypothetical protein HF521_006903 [Silurus meridionalis]|uniref:Uncharacterized protein n=1 Tax=Silurus meridionalis TaxID=175797 RepID=A0A8T0ASX0_SILME|nr:hypothetical protein HF521_006903 [Silurus meridionalis]
MLVETAKSSPHFVRFFYLVKRLYTFLSSSSKRHAAFIQMQKLLYAGEKTWELKQLSDTRWACCENALKAAQKAFSAVIQLLRKILDTNPPDPAEGDALMLFGSINVELMLCLEVPTTVFQETAVASAALQHKDVDLAVSYTLVEQVLKRFQELRTESEFKDVFEKAKERPEAAGIEFPDKIPVSPRARLYATVSPRARLYATVSPRESRAATDPSRESRAATDPSRESRAATDPSRESRAATESSRERRAATESSRERRAATESSRERRAATEALQRPSKGVVPGQRPSSPEVLRGCRSGSTSEHSSGPPRVSFRINA